MYFFHSSFESIPLIKKSISPSLSKSPESIELWDKFGRSKSVLAIKVSPPMF